MLATKELIIEKGRDKGKKFIITEMPAAQADNWAMRVLFALLGNGGDFDIDPQLGMLGMAKIALTALGKVSPDVAVPLLDELLNCAQIVPTGGSPRPLDLSLNDVQDFTTLWTLRKEVFKLHIDFLTSVLGQTSGLAEQPAE